MNKDTNDSLQADRTLVTVNASILVAYFFVFQVELNNAVTRSVVIISLALFIVSLICLLWYLHRFPLRKSILDKRREKTVEDFTNRTASFIEQFLDPLTHHITHEEIRQKTQNAKNNEERKAIIDSLKAKGKEEKVWYKGRSEEQTIRWVIEGFMDQLKHQSKDDFDAAFKKPLKEKYSRVRFVFDLIAFKARRQTFIAGAVFALSSIFIQLISP